MLGTSFGRACCHHRIFGSARRTFSSQRRCSITRFTGSSQCRPHGLAKSSQPLAITMISTRGAKTRSVIKVKDLVPNDIPLSAVEPIPADTVKAYPALLQQARDNMDEYSHCVLLTRVGGFFEMYFEHAEKYGKLLNLKVAVKSPSTRPVSMAGFPFNQLERYLKILVQDMNKHVAIAEEVPNDLSKKIKSGGPLFDRKVTRVITPGTLIDEQFMDPWQSNYLLRVHVDTSSVHQAQDSDSPLSEGIAFIRSNPVEVGLAWLDLSSGDFFTQATTLPLLSSAVARIRPREVLLDVALADARYSDLISQLKNEGHAITFQESLPDMKPGDWTPMLEEAVGSSISTKFCNSEILAGASLLDYVKAQLQKTNTHLQPPVRHKAEDFMSIDKNSFRALEIRSTSRDGTAKGSLLHTVKRTVTPDGTRLLINRLTEPSLSLTAINERLDLVSLMKEENVLRERVVSHLQLTSDSPRIASKFALGRGDADDLISLAKTIEITADLAASIDSFLSSSTNEEDALQSKRSQEHPNHRSSLQSLLGRLSLDHPGKLASRINESIDEDGLSRQHQIEDEQAEAMEGLAQSVVGDEADETETKQFPKKLQPKKQSRIISSSAITGTGQEPFIMRSNASQILQDLHEHLVYLEEQCEELQNDLRNRNGANTLTLKWTPGLGHIAHVKGRDSTKLNSLHDAKPVSSSKSTKSFYVPAWTELGREMDETRLRIRTEEQNVLTSLRQQVVQNLVKLRRNATVLAELDVACGFAELAIERDFIRPILNKGTAHRVVGGRHPVVETGLSRQGRTFTTNDCHVGDQERIWLVTGPNMAGKSTFLRQNALISILAQTGSFVPAEHAEIGLVDKIFTRVGSADNLYQDQSTFMVEMAETAEILKEATPRSFVIMDEVGRGTTPEDGVAVGFACLDHLYRINQCRTIFATHFHTLTDMTRDFEKLGCYCSDVAEQIDGSFSYVHRLRKGVNRQSHALKVARVAGLPEEAIATAARVLRDLKVPTTSSVTPERYVQQKPMQATN